MKYLRAAVVILSAAAVLFVFYVATARLAAVRGALESSVATSTSATSAATSPSHEVSYIEVTDGCGPYFEGTCVNVRSGPGTQYPVVTKLRAGVVLRVASSIESDGHTWYKIAFDEWLRYPERVQGAWYVAGDYVRSFSDNAPEELAPGVHATSTKHIIVDRSEQMLFAYDGNELFMREKISTGIEITPTPRGTFVIFKKTPTRYMQGPIPGISDKMYDLPGVPWNLYFTEQGAVIHGAYWHNHFGEPWSNGCVNLPPQDAKRLYEWADLGTTVTVRD